MPKRRPNYRNDRDHSSFLAKLADFNISIESFEKCFKTHIDEVFDVEDMSEAFDVDKTCHELIEKYNSQERISWAFRTNIESL